VDFDLGVFSLSALEDDFLPALRGQAGHLGKKIFAPLPKGDELYSIEIQLDQVLIGGELGVEDEAFGVVSLGSPKIHKLQHAIRFLAVVYLGVGVAENA
jgi:hypothetical protein